MNAECLTPQNSHISHSVAMHLLSTLRYFAYPFHALQMSLLFSFVFCAVARESQTSEGMTGRKKEALGFVVRAVEISFAFSLSLTSLHATYMDGR